MYRSLNQNGFAEEPLNKKTIMVMVSSRKQIQKLL